ncbi:uncharacterized protein K489DRAFT_375167 [Dissoconium aciculare CBS 342.82]|uniref:Uncharacterized protein n=1 Tax=Dissoconium aciculare CBS 342.82 TaxID=1314786 RepID=A0A6J3MGK1_9PEZI|nr:uncharacterized protein K489DRAFT_375167 [Dissoconium aciculare CBS 342.82]KAF1827080.1 hypothetical protein K489DRAFT_375167 [Dissoconium aciculare CBS 342.82]
MSLTVRRFAALWETITTVSRTTSSKGKHRLARNSLRLSPTSLSNERLRFSFCLLLVVAFPVEVASAKRSSRKVVVPRTVSDC